MLDRDDESSLPDALRGITWTQCDIYDAPEWYDVDYAGYRGEEAFYKFLLQRVATGVVVELGAGTGRLSLEFAREGRRVHAVEPALQMRERLLAKKAKLGVSLSVEDALAQTFTGGDDIAAIFFPFNGLLHVHTRDEMIAAFSHVRSRLRDDGVFALDCTGPYWDAMLYGPSSWGRSDERVHPENGKRVLTCDRARYDSATRAMHIDIRYVCAGEKNGVQVELVQTMWTWQQVLKTMADAGFVVEHLYGDVNLSPFDEAGPRMLVSARKTVATP